MFNFYIIYQRCFLDIHSISNVSIWTQMRNIELRILGWLVHFSKYESIPINTGWKDVFIKSWFFLRVLWERKATLLGYKLPDGCAWTSRTSVGLIDSGNQTSLLLHTWKKWEEKIRLFSFIKLEHFVILEVEGQPKF